MYEANIADTARCKSFWTAQLNRVWLFSFLLFCFDLYCLFVCYCFFLLTTVVVRIFVENVRNFFDSFKTQPLISSRMVVFGNEYKRVHNRYMIRYEYTTSQTERNSNDSWSITYWLDVSCASTLVMYANECQKISLRIQYMQMNIKYY